MVVAETLEERDADKTGDADLPCVRSCPTQNEGWACLQYLCDMDVATHEYMSVLPEYTRVGKGTTIFQLSHAETSFFVLVVGYVPVTWQIISC